MTLDRVDVFEDEKEITKMVEKLQAKGLQHMSIPDAFWDSKFHEKAIKSTNKMGKKVLAQF